MRTWTGLVIGGCIAAALLVPALMPPFPYERFEELTLESEATRAWQEAVAVASALQRLRWLDSIDARWEEASEAGLLLGFDDADASGSLRDSVRALLSRAPGGAEGVGYAAVRADWLLPDSRHVIRMAAGGGPFHLLDPQTGRCVVVQTEENGRRLPLAVERLSRAGGASGPCEWVGRYGPPGDSIRGWLARGGSLLAGSSPAPRERIRVGSPGLLSGSLALPPALTTGEVACIHGDDDACVGVLREPAPWLTRLRPRVAGDPAVSSPWRGGRALGGAGGDMLVELERDVGPERFAAFWRSERPVDVALSEVTGRPAGEWVGAWVRSKVEGPVVRAGLRPLDIGLTLAVVALLAATAVAVGRRRRPG